ncbi:MAG TPA: hypothetical protein VF796_02290 [Humisphaera sp.]
MPPTNLPMFSPAAHPDAWHRVTAPGGYEWWYFDAEDATGRLQLVAIFLEGFVFHPGYLRRYARFLRKPTKTPPPVAGDHPCAYFVVYEDGKILSQFMCEYRREQFAAATDKPEVTIGPNTLRRDDATCGLKLSMSGTPWKLTWQGPKLLAGQNLSAELTFNPIAPPGPMERVFLSRRLSGAEHHWVIADPLCDVAGTIRLADGGAGRTIELRGRGYHDHNYGTAPIGPGLKRWVWGRAIAGDRMYTFHFARPRDAALPDEAHLIRADAAGRGEVAVASTAVDWSRRTALGLAYPAAIDFPPHLRLSNPRVVDSAPFYMRLVYDAELDGGTHRGSAFCEVAYPHRLRWPVLGRMIEMSIHRA